jgi:hypothetical protein
MRGEAAALALVLALVAPGCLGGRSDEDLVEQLLVAYTDADPSFEADLGDVEFADCSRLDDVEYEGEAAFYCDVGNSGTIASFCVARVGERLFFSGGRVMCEDPFRLAYPSR